jgi:hypothetical protein
LVFGLRASGPSEVGRCKRELWPRQRVSCLRCPGPGGIEWQAPGGWRGRRRAGAGGGWSWGWLAARGR